MYTVIKQIEIAGAHRLDLNYESPCSRLHGHNWKIKVYCRAEHLNGNGMVVDFKQIKEDEATRAEFYAVTRQI